ncbi:MAG: hypothetical protein PHV59_11145, partial [Victivallales bacterium]|nr:hypothetical protein [Victivallales bacterium]
MTVNDNDQTIKAGGKWVFKLLSVILVFIALTLYLWSIPALYFLLPWKWLKISVSALFAAGAPAALVLLKPRRRVFFIILILSLAITVRQQSIPPTNRRDWKTSVARLPQIEINGN